MQDITSIIKLHAEDVKAMLEQMSRLKVNKGWEFVLDYDSEFVAKHPDVVQRQYMIWEAKFKQLSSVLKMPPVDHKLAEKAAALTPPKRRRTVSRSRTKSGGDRSMSDMSDTDDVAKAERSRRASGGGKRSGSGSRDRKRSVSGGSERQRHASGPKADHVTFADGSTVVSGDPSTNHTGSADNATKNGPSANNSNEVNSSAAAAQETNTATDIQRELIAFLRAKLDHHVVLRLSEVRSLLSMELTLLAPGHVLGRGVTDRLIEDTMPLASGVRMLNAQIRCGEPVFALKGKGDKLDAIRTVLLDTMQKHKQVFLKAFKNAVDEHLPEGSPAVSEADIKKVVYEYCDRNKSNAFSLKGTNDDVKS